MDQSGSDRVMELIKKSRFSVGELDVFDSVIFVDSEESFLVSVKNGTTLCMTTDCVKEFLRGEVSDDLAFVLIQRGMAAYRASRSVSHTDAHVFPTFFLVDLTKKCSLRCVYCFRELSEESPVMDHAVLASICDELIGYCKKINSDHVTIQPWGGEPMLEFMSILYTRSRFTEAGMHPKITIETNATLITPEKAKLLYENDIEVGVSIDGCAEVHNVQRPFENGAPSLQAVEKGISNLRSAGYKNIFSITVVTKNTIERLDDIIRYYAFELKLNGIKLNLMRKTDRNRELAPDPNQIEGYVEELISCMKNCFERKAEIIEHNISQRLRNLTCRPCDNICNAHGCHGGYRMLSIDAKGDVYPCELSDDPSYRIGHIGDKGFVEMVVEAIENRHEYFLPRELDGCSECPWFFYCRGGCRAAVKYDCGDPRKVDKTECLFNKALYPRLVSILLNEPDFAQYLLNGRV